MISLEHLVPPYNRLDLLRGGKPTPTELADAYSAGFQGVFLDRDGMPEWARTCAKLDWQHLGEALGSIPVIEAGFPRELVGQGKGKRVLNHSYVMKHIPNAFSGNQAYGNCRAWSAKFSTLTLLGMAIQLGQVHRVDYRHGTALVYGSRGSSSQGMTMSRGIEVLTKVGQSEEKDYEFVDLSTQQKDEDAGNKWGRSGPPQELKDAVAGDVVLKAWNLGESPTVDTVRDVLWAEGVIDHGSTYTAAESSNGLISSLRSIGGHAQQAPSYDDTDEMREWVLKECKVDLKGDMLVLNNQSWGNWLSLPKWPEHLWGPRPEGMWVVTGKDFLKILGRWGDGWALTGIDGFVPRRLPDWGSELYL